MTHICVGGTGKGWLKMPQLDLDRIADWSAHMISTETKGNSPRLLLILLHFGFWFTDPAPKDSCAPKAPTPPVTMANTPSRSPPSPSTPQSAELDKIPSDKEKTIQQGEVQFTYGLIKPYPTSPSFLVAVSLQIIQGGTTILYFIICILIVLHL